MFELGPENRTSQLNQLLPPRREWSRFRPRKRSRSATKNNSLISLQRCIQWYLYNSSGSDRVLKLRQFVVSIQRAVLDGASFQFGSPTITAQHKSGHDYRAIASFMRLEDKVVDILNAKYLREKLDITFEESSVAFRGKRRKPINRDSAIDEIFSIRFANLGRPLFVTECDIRGFFDCVHHTVAKRRLRAAILHLKKHDPRIRIDERAIKIFCSYLGCYCFWRNVKSKEGDLRRQVNDLEAAYKWPLNSSKNRSVPDGLDYFHKQPKRARIGIPQGGAHSCLIANLVLDSADKQVGRCLSLVSKADCYLRYCDDIIIISRSKGKCRQATEVYKRCLEELKLPYHQATPLGGTLRQFYNDSKTKECYKWGSGLQRGEFRWIQFLGYQLRFDGEVRVRPPSLVKHKQKIENLRESIAAELRDQSSKVSAKRVLYRFNSKVWAFASGRVNPSVSHGQPLPMCWASGFRQLAKRRFSRSHIRDLDRHVGKNRRRLKRYLMKSKTGSPSVEITKRQLAYFGAPFSHLRQFRRLSI